MKYIIFGTLMKISITNLVKNTPQNIIIEWKRREKNQYTINVKV